MKNENISKNILIDLQKKAIILANRSKMNGEIPVGCIIYNYKTDKIISSSTNKRNKTNNSFHHAEYLAIKKANNKLNYSKIKNCLIISTLEPCLMCFGAIIESGIFNICYGSNNYFYKSTKSLENIVKEINNDKIKIKIFPNILLEETNFLINNFFKKIRNNKNIFI